MQNASIYVEVRSSLFVFLTFLDRVQDFSKKCRNRQAQAVGGGSHFGVDSDLLECYVLEGRGFGYISFSSREAAVEAIDALDDRLVNGWGKPLRCKFATSAIESP